jgi:exodeoxyribonuclease-5
MGAIELNSDQIFASYEAEKWWKSASSDQIFEISGAAGTGKTTSIKYILQKIGLNPLKDVLFVAYTGKAATQLSRNGLPARTCHSAFYEFCKEPDRDENGSLIILPNGKIKKKMVFKPKEYLDKSYKAICIDEATMVNQEMKSVIESFGIPIFALGDTNQLPPVFGKSVFLVNPNVTLRKLMRQAEDDPIIYIAHR